MSSTRATNVASSRAAPDRPIDPSIVRRAQALLSRYPIQLHRDGDSYRGSVKQFTLLMGHGPSKDAARRTTRKLLKWALAYLLESRRPLPAHADS